MSNQINQRPDRREFLQAASLLGLTALAGPVAALSRDTRVAPDLVLYNGRISTLDPARPDVSAVAIKDGMVLAVGSDAELVPLADAQTRVVDVERRRVIPGLTDSHTHVIRGGLNYNTSCGGMACAACMRRSRC
jgi:predicted amidohydrolase YtcJ